MGIKSCRGNETFQWSQQKLISIIIAIMIIIMIDLAYASSFDI